MREYKALVRWTEMLVSVLLICVLCTFPVRAADRIRVGCVDIGNFIQMGPDGYPSGYGAEYLDKIAEYAGWEYEYVQAPWDECLELLKEGKIDLLLPAEYSPERARCYLFSSYECCFDFAALVGRKSDNRLYYDDYSGFNGIRVGMIRGNFLNDTFTEYAKLHGFTYEAVYYDTGTQISEALEREEVDAIINGNMEYNIHQKLLAKIDYMPAYFITSVNRPDLMIRLNQALKQVFIENPYYTASLYEKYYGEMESQFAEFTRGETEFVQASGPVTVLISPDDYPFEWYDEKAGECKGAYIDYMRYLGRISGLTFQFIPAKSGASLKEEMKQKKAQVLLSVFNKTRNRNDEGLSYTIPYYNCSFSLIGKKDVSLNLSAKQRIAVVKQVEGIQELLLKKYPLWEIVLYDTPRECLRAVEEQSVDCAMVSSIKLSADRNMLNTNLVVVDDSTASISVYMAVSGEADPILVQVLSKAIAKAGSGPMDEAMYRTLLSAKEHKDFSYFVRTYPLQFAFTVVAVSLMAMGTVMISYDSRQQKIQNQVLQKKNEELEKAIAMQKLLRHKAQTDILTGLKNKSTTEELCRTCLEHADGQNCALFILDLDDFKSINDERGHQAGDAVLKAFGSTLQRCVRQDDVAGRIGGDEFMLFMSGIKDETQLERFAGRIYAALKENPEFEATCSMGIVLARGGQMAYEEWFKQADHALYQAKATGKNRYHIENLAG